MDSSALLVGSVVIVLINWVGLFIIIRDATRSNEQVRVLKAQFELLREIAFKSGVSEDKVKEIVQHHRKS